MIEAVPFITGFVIGLFIAIIIGLGVVMSKIGSTNYGEDEDD